MSQFTMFADAVLSASRDRGTEAAGHCADKAVRVSAFSVERAREWVVFHLSKHGPTSGEDMVDGMKSAGIEGHDDRCFGTVFASLAKDKRIAQYGTAPRRKGHGTSGAIIWRIVR